MILLGSLIAPIGSSLTLLYTNLQFVRTLLAYIKNKIDIGIIFRLLNFFLIGIDNYFLKKKYFVKAYPILLWDNNYLDTYENKYIGEESCKNRKKIYGYKSFSNLDSTTFGKYIINTLQ